MSEADASDESLPATGVAVGIVFGVGIAATAAALFGGSIAITAGYGAGGGLVVGALTGRLADANRGQDEWAIRVIGGGAALGLAVGLVLGTLLVWSWGDPTLNGLLVGCLGGFVTGLLVGSVLVANERAKE